MVSTKNRVLNVWLNRRLYRELREMGDGGGMRFGRGREERFEGRKNVFDEAEMKGTWEHLDISRTFSSSIR